MSGSSQEYRIVGWVELISSAAKESNTSVVARLAKIKSTLLPLFWLRASSDKRRHDQH